MKFDYLSIVLQNIDLSFLSNQKVLVTGATGLIGKMFINILLEWNRRNTSNRIEVFALARNREKFERFFKETDVNLIVADICNVDKKDYGFDYIVHAASQTSSRSFANEPVNTIVTAIKGTYEMLELARINAVKKFIYLSSMEVYGAPQTAGIVYEESANNIDTMVSRSCYPESKRMCENLCVAYNKEYGVPINVLRLTQTFGPGVTYSDSRVFAEFGRCVIEKRDIVLKTKGETQRSYLHVADAVSAILFVMSKAPDMQAYNVANEETFCSIYDMAMLVANVIAHGEIKVRIDLDDQNDYGFAPELIMNLNTDKIKNLGWNPHFDLQEMFVDMIDDMKL